MAASRTAHLSLPPCLALSTQDGGSFRGGVTAFSCAIVTSILVAYRAHHRSHLLPQYRAPAAPPCGMNLRVDVHGAQRIAASRATLP